MVREQAKPSCTIHREMRTNMATRRTATTKAAPPPEVEEIEDLDVDEDLVDDEEVEEEAPKPKRRAPAARKPAVKKPAARRKAAVEPEPEDDDDEPEETPAPKRRDRSATKATAEKPQPAVKRPEVEYGTQWLVDHVNEECGTAYKAYDLRVLLRKMAKSGELDREVGADRSRYSFGGPNDKLVKAVVKKVGAGAVEAEKKASLDKLKDRTAAKAEAAGNVTPIKKRGRPAKAKPAQVDEEEDFDDDDVEELD
jgi:hypothetical protein